jgi:hypothetical protein
MSNGPSTTPPTGGDSTLAKNSRSNDRQAPLIEWVRAVLAFLVVGLFMGITVTLLLYVLFSKTPVDLKDYAQFFSQTASVYTGIVGVVIGYYFGRSHDRIETAGMTSAEAQRQAASSEGGGAGKSSGTPPIK